MAKPSTFSSRKELRITKAATLETLENVYYSRKGKDSINTILNEALEMGLDYIWQKSVPQKNIDSLIYNATQRIIMNQQRQQDVILNKLNKVSIMLMTNEIMLSSIVQEMEFFFAANNIEIPPEMLQTFINNLPSRFEKEKNYFIGQLFGEEENNEKNT